MNFKSINWLLVGVCLDSLFKVVFLLAVFYMNEHIMTLMDVNRTATLANEEAIKSNITIDQEQTEMLKKITKDRNEFLDAIKRIETKK